LCALGVQLVEDCLAFVVVGAVRVVGFFVFPAASVGTNDGSKGARGDGEEDFEGECEVANE